MARLVDDRAAKGSPLPNQFGLACVQRRLGRRQRVGHDREALRGFRELGADLTHIAFEAL